MTNITLERFKKKKATKETRANGIVKMGFKKTAVFPLNTWKCSSVGAAIFGCTIVLLSLVK